MGKRECAYVEVMELIWVRRADAGCEEQEVALQPFDLVGRKLEPDAWTCFVSHVDER